MSRGSRWRADGADLRLDLIARREGAVVVGDEMMGVGGNRTCSERQDSPGGHEPS